MNEIRVYQINDYEWYAGHSMEECIAYVLELTGESRDEMLQYSMVEPHELTELEMDSLIFRAEEGVMRLTFRQMLRRMIREGEQFPCLFASTIE
jgi:hypothetical protein